MKNKIRKITAIFLVSAVTISSFVWTKAAEDEMTPSKNLLEAILNERSWVLDTIVDGDYTTNPCEYIASTPKFQTYSYELYDRFVSHPGRALLVRLTDIIYNSGQYVSDALYNFTLEELQELAGFYSIIIPDENMDDIDYIITLLANTISSLHKVSEEKYYEYILNGIFTTDFTSPVQITIEEEEASLSELQTLADHYAGIHNIIEAQKDLVKFGLSETENLKYCYINDILTNYEYSINAFLDSHSVVGNTMGYTQKMIDEHRDTFTDSMYTMSMLQKYDVQKDEVVKEWKGDLHGENLLTKTNKILEPVGETVSFVNTALNNYLLIESLQTQKESTLGALDSLYSNTDNQKLRNSVATYRNLINDEFDGLTFLYKTGIDTITDNNLIFDTAAKFITKKVSNLILSHATVSTAKIVSKVPSVIAAIKLTTLVADAVTGVEETAKKVYQIEHALKMIEEMKVAYEESLASYNEEKTEENAKAVLNNLSFLRKIRMFTCKLAHDSAINQLGSPMGKILTGSEEEVLIENWDSQYQSQIDALLSATINPISKKPLNLNENDSITIFADENYAMCKIDGRFYYVGEIAERMMGGINVNNGTINIVNYSEKSNPFYISSINATGNCTIKIQENTKLDVYCISHESGTLTFDIDGDFTVRKSWDVDTTSIKHLGSGNINYNGEVKIVDSDIPKATFIGDSQQYVYGSNANIDNLVFKNTSKEGVEITGNINVNNSFSNIKTSVKGGRNVLLRSTGSIVGSYVHDDLAVENFDYDRNIVFGNGLYVVGSMNITADYAEINGEFSSIGDAAVNVSSNSYVNVRGDTYFKSGTMNVDGIYESSGDINLDSSSSAYFKKIILNGKSPQSIRTTSPISIETLVNNNSSSSGVKVYGTWQISKNIESPSSKIVDGTNIVLMNGSTITDGKLNSGISVCDWSCDYDLNIKGSLNTSGATSFNNGIRIDVDGSFDVAGDISMSDDMIFNIGGDLVSEGNLSVGSNSVINISGDMKQTGGTISADENTVLNIDGNFVQKNGTFLAKETASVDVKSDFVSSSSTLTFGGEVNVDGDAQFTDTALEAKDEMTFHRDFYATSFIGYFEHLKFNSFVPQTYYCDSALSVGDLTLTNFSPGGITIGNTINVAETFKNSSLKIINREKIICKTYVSESTDETLIVEGSFYLSQWDGKSSLHVTESLLVNTDTVIPADKAVTVDGDLRIISGSLTIEDGAVLNVQSNLIGVEGKIILEGSMTVSEDVFLKNVTIEGGGELILCGDFYVGDSLVSRPNVVFKSKIPQVLNGSQIYFNNITFENISSSGVDSVSTVYYYGEMINESNLTKFNPEEFMYKEEA